MASIEVDVAALSTLAHRCDQQASRFERMTVPPTQGYPRMQPSAVAISVAYADIAAARARFAARMHDTAAAVVSGCF